MWTLLTFLYSAFGLYLAAFCVRSTGWPHGGWLHGLWVLSIIGLLWPVILLAVFAPD